MAFNVVVLSNMMGNLSQKIFPNFRKKRQYISSILSKNEIDSSSPYNYKIFKRVKRGFYILNPDLKIRIKDKWLGLDD
ncbi:hypothetical protein OAO18_05740 [Francisellaceae bacterium]|nr:hypothetical protein [Francisellaceae bacterium]